MHFGFFRWGMNPFQREAMLEQMNHEVLDRLHLNGESSARTPARILDMGCGLGATLRSFARRFPWADLNGITLVPWQLEQGQRLNQSCPQAGRITLTLGRLRTHKRIRPHPSTLSTRSRAVAMPMAPNKSAFLQEAHRLLRPGGRIVVADGFLGPRQAAWPTEAHLPQAL